MSQPCLYVYYTLPPDALAATVAQVRAQQRSLLQAHAGLRAELLRRPGLNNGQVTLMEAYTGALPPGLAQALDQAAADAGWPTPRHAEWFEPID